MKKCTLLSVCVLLAILTASSPAFSQNKIESWYTYWGLGYADIKYGDPLDTILDQLSEQEGVDHVSVSVDFLGLYLPSKDRHIYGFVINAFGDRYEVGGSDFQISGYTLSFSNMRFLTGTIGNGLFIRADIGGSRFVVDVDGDTETSDWGFGYLVGGGLGFNITSGTRLLLNVNYAVRTIPNDETGTDKIKTLGFSVGALF